MGTVFTNGHLGQSFKWKVRVYEADTDGWMSQVQAGGHPLESGDDDVFRIALPKKKRRVQEPHNAYRGYQGRNGLIGANSVGVVLNIDAAKIGFEYLPIHGVNGLSVVQELPHIFEWSCQRHRPGDWAPADFYPIQWKSGNP